jgi:hypothetical protein
LCRFLTVQAGKFEKIEQNNTILLPLLHDCAGIV